MNKVLLLAVVAFSFMPVFGETIGDQIGAAGDKFWNNQINKYKDSGDFVENTDAEIIASDLNSYKGKMIMFPEVVWEDFYTYRGNKYYYNGSNGNYFIMEDEPDLKKKLQRVAGFSGPLGDKVEAIGIIEDADQWLGSSFVIVKMVAMRFPGKAAIIKSGNTVKLAGEDLMKSALAEASSSWYQNVPSELSDSDYANPETVAKAFLYYGNVTKDQETWKTSLSKWAKSGDGLGAKGQSFWRNLSKDERTYTFVRFNEERSSDTKKYYSYTFNYNGKESSIKTMLLEKEDGKWLVSSFPG